MYMNPTVYVFTGSGNSLAVAREIARKTDAKVVKIRDSVKPVIPAGGCAGIVFPVYAWGPPLIVQRFISRMKAGKNAYIFSVANCANSPGSANSIVKKLLWKKKIPLSSSFIVKMPSNYIVFFGAEKTKNQQRKFSLMKESAKKIGSVVKERKSHFEPGGIMYRLFGASVLNKLFLSHAAASDKKFFADSSCNGCGVCEKICPVKNIKLVNRRPVWKHRCEQCFACIQWCPREAIQYGKGSSTKKRYHHPEIRLVDMLK